MKTTILTFLVAAVLSPLTFAEDKPADGKCEMMKKPAVVMQSDAAERQTELEQLVTEMNSNVGPKKIEAMAAILTRLVAQSNATGTHDHTATKTAGKEETPHH